MGWKVRGLKPRRIGKDIPTFQILDEETIRVPRPRRIDGRVPWRMPAVGSPYRVTECPACGWPAVWFDARVRNRAQYNQCTHCDTRIGLTLSTLRGRIKKRWIAEPGG